LKQKPANSFAQNLVPYSGQSAVNIEITSAVYLSQPFTYSGKPAVNIMIHSLGHSTHPKEDFISICQEANLHTIIDTRSHPGSTNYPHYNKEQIEQWLPAAGINYEWWPNLGGWTNRHLPLTQEYQQYDVDITQYQTAFPKQRIAKKRPLPETDKGFTNYGFHDYQFYMTLPEFLHAIDNLLKRRERLACICSEGYWAKCHRSMIADYLIWLGKEMWHIQPRSRKIKKPRIIINYYPHSTVIGDRLNRYHPHVIQTWEHYKTPLQNNQIH
jgi:hypothetical protein